LEILTDLKEWLELRIGAEGALAESLQGKSSSIQQCIAEILQVFVIKLAN
jgi:hypothetical protein